MFTGNLETRPSRRIRLHRLIICRSEILALELINRINLQPIDPHTISTFNGAKLCLVSTRGYISIPDEIIGRVRIINKDIPARRILAAKSPHLFEINGVMQDALHLAAAYGLRLVVERLLDIGANPNYQDGSGRTALHYAAGNRYNEIIHLLVSRGARIDLKDATLSFPFNSYLIGSREAQPLDQKALSELQIDYLSTHRNRDGRLGSEKFTGQTAAYHLQRFREDIDRLKIKADDASKLFGCEFYAARREQREPEKNIELDISRQQLIIMLKIINIILRVPEENLDELIRNKAIMMAFQFFGGLIDSLAKEVKCPYQDRMPWNSLAFLACLFNEPRIFTSQASTNRVKLFVKTTLPILKTEIVHIIREFPEWLEKNRTLPPHVPPYRHVDFVPLYNLTDYLHDLRTLSEMLKHLDKMKLLDPQTLHGRHGLLQIVKTTADLAKYQHAGRNLTRTVKQKFYQFPWHGFGELRDKLAKISLAQENTDVIQDLLQNNPVFFINLQKELNVLRENLVKIYSQLDALNDMALENYYKDEPKDSIQAREDMPLLSPIAQSAMQNLMTLISEVKDKKIQSRLLECDKAKTQMKGIQANQRMLLKIKEEQIKRLEDKCQKINQEIADISAPFEKLSQDIQVSGVITLEQQRYLLSQIDHAQRNIVKGIISESSDFKYILELESSLHMRPDAAFSDLSNPEKLIVINRTEQHLRELATLVIPDPERREQLYDNEDIFEPGHDEFGSYLIAQYNRIVSDPNLLYSAYFLAIEVQQSLKFLGLGGNTAFRIHLEHNEATFDAIAPDRLSEELNEILRNITKDSSTLAKLKMANTPRSLSSSPSPRPAKRVARC